MLFLGSPLVSGLMDSRGMLMLAVYFTLLMAAFSLVGSHYKAERELAEEKVMEYETVVESGDSGQEDSDTEAGHSSQQGHSRAWLAWCQRRN